MKQHAYIWNNKFLKQIIQIIVVTCKETVFQIVNIKHI